MVKSVSLRDPMADGIVIQMPPPAPMQRNVSPHPLLSSWDIRRDVRIPLILMGYLNPIMHFGFGAFCRKCTECGIDGVIIPTCLSRECKKIIRPSHRNTTYGSSCHHPETSEKRIREIDTIPTDSSIWYHQQPPPRAEDFDTGNKSISRKFRYEPANPRMVGFISNQQTFDTACSQPRPEPSSEAASLPCSTIQNTKKPSHI